MRLATLKSTTSRDGTLVVLNKNHTYFLSAKAVVPNLRTAIETWRTTSPQLQELAQSLEQAGAQHPDAQVVKWEQFHSPLPRSFQWADGSAFLHHVRLVRKARNAPIPESIYQVPLMYQGGSDDFLAPTDTIPFVDDKLGLDFEGEVAVITDFVPMGSSPEKALELIRLVVLVNDVTLRGLIPDELAMGFGFFQSKPSSAFSPVALTPEELGEAWQNGRVHLPLHVQLNHKFFGKANAGEMHFSFGQLIAHAARTRNLSAGTIIGSGTVSNDKPDVGSSCLVERRMLEQITDGTPKTQYLQPGDHVRIYMTDTQGKDLFGEINQRVENVSFTSPER